MEQPPKKGVQGQQAQDDVVRHGGALSGMVVGGLAGSILPGIGTVTGMVVGALAGHFLRDRNR